MKKTTALLTCFLALTTTTAFAKMTYNWDTRQGPVPHDFRGKVIKFYYSNTAPLLNKNDNPDVSIDVIDSADHVIQVSFTGSDFPFGASLHSTVGKNVGFLVSENTNIITQFSLLNSENRWFNGTSN
jgi:hypothetical protein